MKDLLAKKLMSVDIDNVHVSLKVSHVRSEDIAYSALCESKGEQLKLTVEVPFFKEGKRQFSFDLKGFSLRRKRF
ncbi:hypothetical protein IBT49_14265 [Erwinia sp. S63]|uniref:hypothetical protein n=1 Tax=Erwinia sp. S63 TaxID=2769341 RepID=UPI00190BE565|nr:hypothetical protein [Erwinia sp. S63]MBK0097146.1 hypothetical protein [Erwinia sp. S63]